jgi:hypothetical protein
VQVENGIMVTTYLAATVTINVRVDRWSLRVLGVRVWGGGLQFGNERK